MEGIRLRLIISLVVVAAMLPLAALAQSPTAHYWGTVFSGPPGVTPIFTETTPTAVTLDGTVVQVGTSNSTEYALLSDGTVWAWGIGAQGELGNGTVTGYSATPVEVDFPAGVAIAKLATDAMPFDAALAIDTKGNVWGWGDTATGALCKHGTGVPADYTTPVQLPLSDVTLVAGASAHTIFDAGGSLYACGALFQYPALGTGLDAAAYTPTLVAGMQDVAVLGVYASSVDSYALLATGQVWAWGSNAEDQLGDGASGGISDVPIRVSFSDASPVVQVAAGGDAATNGSTLVELADDTYWSWGAGNAYQLGNGISGNQPSPIEFFPPTGVTYSLLASGAATSYGVDTRGDLWSWGQGGRGQIGNGKQKTASSPVTAITGGVTMISATAQDVEVG